MPCPHLIGDGTKDSPYQIFTFDDFLNIDLDILASDDHDLGLYFKLMKDVDLSRDKRLWFGRDLNFGYLDLNGFSIVSPKIRSDSYLFRNTTIYSTGLEWDGTGNVKTEGVGGYILDIKGSDVRAAFINCDFDYVYIDASNVDVETYRGINQPIFESISANRTYIKISVDRSKSHNNSPITCKKEGLKDTCIEYTGMTRDYPLVAPRGDDAIVLDHCMIRGGMNLKDMRYGAESSEIPLINATVKSCIFAIKSNRPDGDAGFRKYATATEGVNVAIKSIHRGGNGVNVGDAGDVIEVDENVLYNPTELKATGLDVFEYIEEGDGT